MVINKKGIFFTLIAITLLSLLAVSITIVSLSHERETIKKRVNSLNGYVYSLEQDIPRKLYISAYRSLFLYEKRILEQGTYLTDVNALFNETFFNGTIQGTITSDEQTILEGMSYNDIKTDIIAEGQEWSVNITITNPTINLGQTDPWNVEVSLNISLFILDLAGTASWNKTTTYYTYIPIKNFEDPLYLISTNGLIAHKMIPSPHPNIINENDITNLTDNLNNNYYWENPDAPNFINRLEGNLSANEQGIESFVNLPELTTQGLPTLDKTIIDHHYFSTNNPATKRITGMPSWFKIDDNHISDYNLTAIAY